MDHNEPRSDASGCLSDAAFGLLGLVWGLGTPYLAYGAIITSAPFFGEAPTAAEFAAAKRLMLGALACGLITPLVGLSLGLVLRRRVAALTFAVALGLSVLAGVATGVLSEDSLRSLGPPTSTTQRRPIPCQEYSGGDTHCPGGSVSARRNAIQLSQRLRQLVPGRGRGGRRQPGRAALSAAARRGGRRV